MKVILCGGGTAGHINPALAIGKIIQKECPGTQILYVGAKGGMEETLVPKAGVEFRSIKVSGFRRSFSPRDIAHNFRAASRAVTSQFSAKKIIKEFAPDLVVGTGGYVSGPVVRQAAKLGIKTVIHEQNAYPGVTTKLLAPKVSRVLVAVPKALDYLERKDNTAVVGNPVRAEVFTADRDAVRAAKKIEDKTVLLSFGGSLGARALNEAIADVMKWEESRTDLYHIHATGSAGKEEFAAMLAKRGIDPKKRKDLEIRTYIDDMPDMLAAADLVICRAGASTLSELEVAGRGSILIPYPYAAENHQYHNAKVLADRGGAVVIQQKDLTGEGLIQTVRDLTETADALKTLGENAAKGAVLDAGEKIWAEIRSVME